MCCMARGGPWTDEETLRKEYVDNGKTRQELADQWDCAEGTIQYWQEKFGIDRRDTGGAEKDANYRDKETLERMYNQEDMSLSEMADEFDCAVMTVYSWMDRHGLERDKAPDDSTHPPHHMFKPGYDHIVGSEYEIIQTRVDGTLHSFQVHRLVALAHGIIEPDEFFDKDVVVHHESEHGLDNRPENLHKMGRADHSGYHHSTIGQQ